MRTLRLHDRIFLWTRGSLGALSLVLSVVLVLWQARSAFADNLADEAELEFEVGAEHYGAGDFKGALEHFLASNRLVANRNVVFNIARAYEQLKLNIFAFRYYSQALESETDPTTRARIQQAIARIEPNIAVLVIESEPRGATAYVDRKDLGARGNTPLKLGLDPGSYRIFVELGGYEPVEIPLAVPVGTETPLKVRLKQIVGQVRVDGEPAGASVFLDSEDSSALGVIPGRFAIVPGRHTLIVGKEGFTAATVPINVAADETITVRPHLAAIAGNLVVNSDVRDALVEIDGRATGFTPAVLNIPIGSHSVKVSLAGFRPVENTVLVTASGQAKLDVQLAQVEEVTAASRVTENVEDAPSSVSIITGEELRAMGYPTVAEALRGIRGVYVGNDTSYDSIGVRGFSRPGDYGTRVLVLLDGHPLNDNWLGQSYFGYDGRVNLSDIERIEFVRGPGSVVYGTGAFLGVINLVTRNRNAATHTEAGASASGAGVGTARVMQQLRFSPDAGLWTSLAAGHGAGNDYFFQEYFSDAATGGYSRGNDRFDAGNVTGRAWYKWATLQWYLNSRDKTLPTGVYGTVYGDPRTHYTDTRATLELRLEPKIGKQVEWLTRAYLDMYNFDDFLPYLVEAGGNATESYRGQWAGLEQRIAYVPGKMLRVTLGGLFQDDYKAVESGFTSSSVYLSPSINHSFQVAAGYGSVDFAPIRELKFTAGARYDYYSNFGGSLNPRVAAILKPYEAGNVKVMFGKAFRAPSVYEHTYQNSVEYPGDCGQVTSASTACLARAPLEPENVYSGELEVTHHFSPTASVILAGYTNYISRVIDLAGGGTAASPNQYVNISNPIQTYGGELELRRDWRDGWMAAATYSYQETSYLDNQTTRLRNVPTSPHHLGSLKAAAPLLGHVLVLGTRATFLGPMWDKYDAPTDPMQSQTPPVFLWDLVLSGEAERYGLRYNLGLYNATNQKWSWPVSREYTQDVILQNGRTVLARTSVSF